MYIVIYKPYTRTFLLARLGIQKRKHTFISFLQNPSLSHVPSPKWIVHFWSPGPSPCFSLQRFPHFQIPTTSLLQIVPILSEERCKKDQTRVCGHSYHFPVLHKVGCVAGTPGCGNSAGPQPILRTGQIPRVQGFLLKPYSAFPYLMGKNTPSKYAVVDKLFMEPLLNSGHWAS